MSLSSNQTILRGNFTSNGVSATVNLPWRPNRFELINVTSFADGGAANTDVILAEWREGLADNSVITSRHTSGARTLQITDIFIVDGIRVEDTSIQTPGAQLANPITAITAATPAVVSQTAHGLIVNDRVRIYNTTAMLNIAGMDFTVTAVPGANSFTLGFLDTNVAPFAGNPATAGQTRLLSDNPIYSPRRLFITTITQAASAVITMSVTHGLVVGQVLRVKVPAAFGMVEIDGLQGEITAVSVANNTVTVNIDSTAFTAFQFPTSAAAAAGVDFALVVPFGNNSTTVVNALDNIATFRVFMGTNAIGPNNDVMHWIATRALAL